jgi:Major tropism determinant N-terminal domain
MSRQITLRKDSATNWATTNPTLALGEPGYDTDAKNIKIGDGSTIWTNLSFLIPTPFSLPIASTTVLGGVKIDGTSITISNGVISASYSYTLPSATSSVLGGVIIGSGINNSNGTISVTPYTLPQATTSTLGGVIVGSNITVSAGTISISSVPWSVVATTPTSIAGYGIVMTTSDITTALGYTPINSNQIGAVGGLATLDGSGHLTSSQIPTALVGALVYQGIWDASNNVPSLVSGVGTKGSYYKVSVAGTTTIDGNSQWLVGDMIVFDGSVWDRIEGESTSVVSFNTRIGAITLSSSDVTTALAYTPYNATNPSNYLTVSTLPIATTSTAGIVTIGSGINVSGGAISISSIPWSDITTTPTTITGYGIVMTSLDVTTALGFTPYNATNPSSYLTASTLPIATSTEAGIVTIGSGINVTSGTISVTPYTLAAATTSTLGGVVVDGTTIAINGSGVISVINDLTASKIVKFASAPTVPAPAESDLYYDTTAHKAFCFDGTAWQALW